MFLRKLTAHNFVCYKEISIDAFPESGLIGIKGINLDSPVMGSNGCGKSVFLEMLTYSWHGEIMRKKQANIVGPFAKSMSIETIWFDKYHNTEYRFIREKSNTGGSRVKFIVNGKVYSGTPTKIQPIINKTIGIGWNTFKNCIIYSDDAASDHFIHSADNKRKEILSEIADILHLRVARKLIAKDLIKAESELKFLQGKLSSMLNIKTQISNALGKDQIALAEFEKNILEKETKIKDEIDRHRKIVEQGPTLKTKIEKLRKNISLFNESKNRIEEELSRFKISSVEEQLKKEEIELRVTEDKLKKIISDKEKIIKLKKCPTCLTESSNINMSNLTLEENKLKRLFKEIKLRIVKLNDQIQNYNSISTQREDIKKHISKLNEEIEVIEKQLLKINMVAAQIKLNEEKLSSIRNTREHLELRVNDQLEELEEANQAYRRQFFIERKHKINIEALTFWKTQTGQRGIEATFISDLVDILREKANSYLMDLSDGSISIDIANTDKNEIAVDIISGGIIKDFRLYSGGQKNRIEKAISLGLMELQNAQIDVRLFDEIGKNLSQEGYDRVVSLMKHIFRDQQIYMATNNDEIERYFDHRMIMTMENGKTSIDFNW
jgi:DNA repair exonuclease SbcCD ATPase subunit